RGKAWRARDSSPSPSPAVPPACRPLSPFLPRSPWPVWRTSRSSRSSRSSSRCDGIAAAPLSFSASARRRSTASFARTASTTEAPEGGSGRGLWDLVPDTFADKAVEHLVGTDEVSARHTRGRGDQAIHGITQAGEGRELKALLD